jgi:MOSC domain-containing protein YiiM
MTFSTAFIKHAVKGPIWLRETNLEGDRQANTRVHGGPDMAVLAYGADHYTLWHEELGMPMLTYGGFGENFAISNLNENEVCIGDVYNIGEAQVEVTQPRRPCANISYRWNRRDLTSRVEATGRTGWYLRVLVEAQVEAGLEVRLNRRPNPEWSITRAHAAMRARKEDPDEASGLAMLEELSESWRKALLRDI